MKHKYAINNIKGLTCLSLKELRSNPKLVHVGFTAESMAL